MINNKYKKAIPILIIIIGIIFIILSSIMNEYIDGDMKTINLHYTSKQKSEEWINSFNFIHDFTNNNGKISFNTGNQKIKFYNINFNFFTPIKITDIYAIKYNDIIINNKINRIEKRIDFDYNLNGNSTIEHSKYYVFKKFNEEKRSDFSFIPINKIFESEKIVVEFKSNFEPDGTFIIRTNNNNKINWGSGGYSKSNINFILGNDYILTELTFLTNNIKELYDSSDTSINLGITEFNNKEIIFKLNSINKKISNLKTIFMGLGISFFSSGLILEIAKYN